MKGIMIITLIYLGIISTSLNEAGELNEDGLRLEAAWDYADWSKE